MLSVVVPVYNEEKSIEEAVRRIKKHCPGSDIIIVNDGSTDRTAELARGLKVKLLHHKVNKGYGAALKTGLSQIKTEYAAFLDADMTYDPKYIPLLLKHAVDEGLDVTWGNRFGKDFNRMPMVRKVGNRIISLVMLIVTRRRVSDCASGEKLLRKDILDKLGLQELPNDLDFITALTKRIVTRGVKYKEIPINYEEREGKSKLRIFTHGYRMIKNILKY
jgi:glycosyltransferase involved in cell wall biosynthesis